MGTVTSTLKISVFDAATGKLRAISGALGRFQAQNRGFVAPIGGMLGRIAALGAGYIGLTQGAEATVGAAREMQSQLTEIGIKAGLTKGQLSQLQAQMTGLSPRVNQSTKDLLAGVDAMVALGLTANDAAASLPAIGKAATATQSSITDLASASVSAMQNLGVAPQQIETMLNGMAAAGNAGAFEMRDMAQYFPALTASAKALGMEGVSAVNDMAAALQIARRGAGDSSTAANNMANALAKMMSPDTIKNFKKFGVNVTKELAKAKKDGISPIEAFIKLVDKTTKGGRADLVSQLFGDRQVQDFLRPMLSDFKDYLRIRDEADASSGTVDAAYAQRMQNAEEKIKSFRIQVENLGVSIGKRALGPLGDLAARLANILNTSGQRISIFDQITTAMDGFAKGFGEDGAKGALGRFGTFLEDTIFGSKFDDAADKIDRRRRDLEAMGEAFRQLGALGRDLVGNLGKGDIGSALGNIADAMKSMSGTMTVGGALAIALTGGALMKLAAGASALAFSSVGRIFIMAMATASLIDAVKGSGSIGEFADNLGKLSTVDWIGITAGILMALGAAKQLLDVFRSLRGATPGGGKVTPPGAGGKTVPTGGKVTPPAPPTAASGAKAGAGLLGLARASLPAVLATAAAVLAQQIIARTTAAVQRDNLADAWKFDSQGKTEDAANRYRLWHGVPFEGGMHRAGRGAGPAPGIDLAPLAAAVQSNNGAISKMLAGMDRLTAKFDTSIVEDRASRFRIPTPTPRPDPFTAPTPTPRPAEASGPKQVSILGEPRVSIMGVPTVNAPPIGTQNVHVMNPMPAPIINVTVNATTNANPHEIAGAVEASISAKLNALSRGSFSDGAN